MPETGQWMLFSGAKRLALPHHGHRHAVSGQSVAGVRFEGTNPLAEGACGHLQLSAAAIVDYGPNEDMELRIAPDVRLVKYSSVYCQPLQFSLLEVDSEIVVSAYRTMRMGELLVTSGVPLYESLDTSFKVCLMGEAFGRATEKAFLSGAEEHGFDRMIKLLPAEFIKYVNEDACSGRRANPESASYIATSPKQDMVDDSIRKIFKERPSGLLNTHFLEAGMVSAKRALLAIASPELELPQVVDFVRQFLQRL
jgi:hypothetical protein